MYSGHVHVGKTLSPPPPPSLLNNSSSCTFPHINTQEMQFGKCSLPHCPIRRVGVNCLNDVMFKLLWVRLFIVILLDGTDMVETSSPLFAWPIVQVTWWILVRHGSVRNELPERDGLVFWSYVVLGKLIDVVQERVSRLAAFLCSKTICLYVVTVHFAKDKEESHPTYHAHACGSPHVTNALGSTYADGSNDIGG
jgi:hypothetical protein